MTPFYIKTRNETEVFWSTSSETNYKCPTCGREAYKDPSVVGDFCVDEKYHNKKPGARTCGCKWCIKEHPRYREVIKALDGNNKKFVEELFDKVSYLEEDLNYANCLLDGSWPGWEWIKEEKEKHGVM